MNTKLIALFAFLTIFLASTDAYRIFDIQNDFSELADLNEAKTDDLYFISEEKDEKFEQKLSQAEEKLKIFEEKLKIMEENEENLKLQLKKSQEDIRRNRKEKRQYLRKKYENDYEDSLLEKPAKGFWDVVCQISKSFLNSLLNFFGINIAKF